jgi:transposase
MARPKHMTREYFRLSVAGCLPSEIAQRCGVSPITVSLWRRKHAREVRQAEELYRHGVISSLLREQLARVQQVRQGLHLTQEEAGAALAPQAVLRCLPAYSVQDTGCTVDASAESVL